MILFWYPLSPAAASWFVAIVASSYLARVIACRFDERLAPSFRRRLARQTTTNTTAYIFQRRQARRVSDQSKSQRHPPASSSRSLGPYCFTLNTGVVGSTLLAAVRGLFFFLSRQIWLFALVVCLFGFLLFI